MLRSFQRWILNEEKNKGSGANQKKGGDGLVGPAILLQEVANHETDAEEGDEHGDGDYNGGSGQGGVGVKDGGDEGGGVGGDGHGFCCGLW